MKKKGKKSNIVVSGLLDYLTETGQRELLPEVESELRQLIRESKKADVITVKSSTPLTSEQYKQLKKILKALIRIELPLKNEIDKSLIGGFTIKVGDWFLDASISSELTNIKSLLLS